MAKTNISNSNLITMTAKDFSELLENVKTPEEFVTNVSRETLDDISKGRYDLALASLKNGITYAQQVALVAAVGSQEVYIQACKHLRGENNTDIAGDLGIASATVSANLKRLAGKKDMEWFDYHSAGTKRTAAIDLSF